MESSITNVSGKPLSAEELQSLLEGKPDVSEIHLRSCDLQDGQIKAIVSLPSFRSLRVLELGCTDIGPEGFQMLLQADFFPQLEKLLLYQNVIGNRGLRAIEHIAPHATLTHLNVCGNQLGPAAAEILAKAPLKALRSLHIGYNQLGDEGAQILAEIQHTSPLEELNIKLNALGPRGVAFLMQGPFLRGIQKLSFEQSPLGDEGVMHIAQSPHASSLRFLHLGDTQMGLEGLRKLCSSPWLRHLEILRLDHNFLGSEALEPLTNATFSQHLQELVLNKTQITHQALKDAFGPLGGKVYEEGRVLFAR